MPGPLAVNGQKREWLFPGIVPYRGILACRQRTRKYPSILRALAARRDAENRERLAFARFLVPHA